MQQKFEQYKNFKWTESEQWQIYYSNITPIPTRQQLEKIKRKWYRNNIDKDFDINYEPSQEETK